MLSKKFNSPPDPKIIQLEQLIIHLKSELAQYKERVKELERDSDIKELLDENRDLLRRLEDAREFAREAEEMKEQFKEEIYRLENKNQQLKMEIEALQEQLSYSDDQINEPETSPDDIMHQNEVFFENIRQTIQEDLKQHLKRFETLLSPLFEEQDTKMKDPAVLFEQLQEKLENLAESVLNDFQADFVKDKAAELTNKLTAIQENMELLTDKLSLFTEQTQSYMKEEENFRTDMKHYAMTAASYKQDLDNLTSELNRLKQQEFLLQQQLEQLQEENSKYRDQEQILKTEAEHLKQSLGAHENKAKNVMEEIQQLKEENTKLLQKEAELTKELEQLKSKLVQENDQQKTLTFTIEQLKKENSQLSEKEKKYLAQIQELENKLQEQEKEQENNVTKLKFPIPKQVNKEEILPADRSASQLIKHTKSEQGADSFSYKFSRSDSKKNPNSGMSVPNPFEKTVITNRLYVSTNQNGNYDEERKTSKNQKNLPRQNSLNHFYENNPLYQNSATQQNSINPFRKLN